MPRIVLVQSLAFLACVFPALAEVNDRPKQPGDRKDAKSDNDKVQGVIQALEKQGWEALKKQDAAALKRLTTEDFMAIFADASRVDRDGLLKMLPDFRVTAYSIAAFQMIRLNADAAIITFRATYESTYKGESKKDDVQASSTYVRRSGKWLNIFYQESPVKK